MKIIMLGTPGAGKGRQASGSAGEGEVPRI